MSLPLLSPAKPSLTAGTSPHFRRSLVAEHRQLHQPSAVTASPPSLASPTKTFDRFVVDDLIRHRGKTGHQAYVLEAERQQNNGFLRCERPIGLIDHSVTQQANKRPQNQGHFTFTLKNMSIYTLCFLFLFTVKMKRLLGRKTSHEQMIEFTAKVEKLKAQKASALEFTGATRISARQKMQCAWRNANGVVREHVAASHRRALVAKAFHVPSLPKRVDSTRRRRVEVEESNTEQTCDIDDVDDAVEQSLKNHNSERLLSLCDDAVMAESSNLQKSLEVSMVGESTTSAPTASDEQPFTAARRSGADEAISSSLLLRSSATGGSAAAPSLSQHYLGKSGRVRTFPLANILFPDGGEETESSARPSRTTAIVEDHHDADDDLIQPLKLRRRSDITSSLSLKKHSMIVKPRPRDRNAFVMNTDWEDAPFVHLKERCKPVDRPQSFIAPSSLLQYTKTKIPNFVSLPGMVRPPNVASDGSGCNAKNDVTVKNASSVVDPFTLVRSKNARSGADYGPACPTISSAVDAGYNYREWRGKQQTALQSYLLNEIYVLGKELVEYANDPASATDPSAVHRVEQQLEMRREELERLRVLGHSPDYSFDESAVQTHDKFQIVLTNEEVGFFENVGAEYQRLVSQKHSVVLPAKRSKLLFGEVNHPDWRAHMRKVHADCAARVKHQQLCEALKYNANWVSVLRAQLLDSIVDPTPLERRVFDVTLDCVHRVGRDTLNMQDFARNVMSQFSCEELLDLNVQFILERHLPLFGGSVDGLKALFAERSVQYLLLEKKDWVERRAFVSASDKEQTAIHEIRHINSVMTINSRLGPLLESQMHLAATEAENRVRKAREEAAATRRASIMNLNGPRRKLSKITQADSLAVQQSLPLL